MASDERWSQFWELQGRGHLEGREGELGTKTRCSGSTEELINSGDEEKKEGWWFKIHTRYKFVGKAYEWNCLSDLCNVWQAWEGTGVA